MIVLATDLKLGEVILKKANELSMLSKGWAWIMLTDVTEMVNLTQ